MELKNYGRSSEVLEDGKLVFLGTYEDCEKYLKPSKCNCIVPSMPIGFTQMTSVKCQNCKGVLNG